MKVENATEMTLFKNKPFRSNSFWQIYVQYMWADLFNLKLHDWFWFVNVMGIYYVHGSYRKS